MKPVFSFPMQGIRTALWRRHYLIDSGLAIGGIALVTSIAIAQSVSPGNPLVMYIYQKPYETVGFLYLFVVLALACIRGFYAAILASILAFFGFDLLFTPPYYSLSVEDTSPHGLLSLAVLLVFAILISLMSATQRKLALEAKMRERELRTLYGQAQELAALQERHRLARELHDSVSQALYGISLGAHSTREELEVKYGQEQPEQAMASLAYVIALAEAGMAEMRALIFELRPESLETEGLVAAFAKQVAVLRTRYKLDVKTELCEEPVLPLARKEALYRVAYEALHNIVKHAHASMVRLWLFDQENVVGLEISDNGRGFNPDGEYPGHLGLSSMRERVMKAGGTITIESAVGMGTQISVRVSK
jgi:signal transduction histidine kinase